MNAHTLQALESEIQHALSDAESAIEQSADGAGALAKIRAARARLAAASGRAVEQGKAAAKATDAYAHEHPWHIVGAAAAVGVVLGLLISRRR